MKNTLLIIISIFFIACSQSKKQNTDFEKRVEIDEHGKLSLYYLYTKATVKNAGLIPLDIGYDSFCIRFWYSHLDTNDKQVVEIKKENNNWSGNYYYLKLDTNKIKLLYPNGFIKIPDTGINYYYVDSTYTMYKIDKKKKLEEKVINWKSFTDTLFAINFENFPDCRNISDYQFASHNSTVTIEIANEKFYRIFSFQSLFLNKENRYVMKVEKAVKLIQKNFGINPLFPL